MTETQRRFGPIPDGPPDYPLVDVHVHVGPSDSGEIYYPTLSGEAYVELAAAAGVRVACAFAPYRTDGYRAANAALREWAAGTGENGVGSGVGSGVGKGVEVLAFARLGGPVVPFAQLPPKPWQVRRRISPRSRRRPTDVPDSLDGFGGVKLLPHLDGLPDDETFEAISDRALPVLVHCGRFVPPQWVAKAVLPRVSGPVVLGHLGAYPHEARMLETALSLAAEHPRLYLETSGIWDSAFVRRAVEAVPHKVLFGSDAPLTTPAVAWQHVATAVDDPVAMRLLGSTTPTAVLGRGVVS